MRRMLKPDMFAIEAEDSEKKSEKLVELGDKWKLLTSGDGVRVRIIPDSTLDHVKNTGLGG